jgi:hypothetical protein
VTDENLTAQGPVMADSPIDEAVRAQAAAWFSEYDKCSLFPEMLALDAYAAGHAAAQQQEQAACVACEGKPAPENSPCGLCGRTTPRPAQQGRAVAVEVDLLPLPEGESSSFGNYEVHTNETMIDYARANVARNTALLQAEIEALRAEVERLTFEMGCLQQQYDERTAYMIVHRGAWLACSDAVRSAYSDEHHRAERLAEALRIAKETMLSQVKWEACDCGCPQGRKPADAVSVTWLRAVQQVEIATARAEEGK